MTRRGCGCCAGSGSSSSSVTPPACSGGTRTGVRVTISGLTDCSDDASCGDGCDRTWSVGNGVYEFVPATPPADCSGGNYFMQESVLLYSGCGDNPCNDSHWLAICVRFFCSDNELGANIGVREDTVDLGTHEGCGSGNCDFTPQTQYLEDGSHTESGAWNTCCDPRPPFNVCGLGSGQNITVEVEFF